jgi:hypothetical protein
MSEKIISEGNYNYEFSDAALLCAEVGSSWYVGGPF